MGKYFGTDGIRGIANVELDVELAYKTGFSLAYVLGSEQYYRPRVLIGRDTRISGTMLEAGLTAGLCAAGVDVVSVGVMPTPAIAYLTTQSEKCVAGIVISASHNPFEHNGIKIFGYDGYKLTDIQEQAIETYIDNLPEHGRKIGKDTGHGRPFGGGDSVQYYVDYLVSTAPCKLDGLRILVDCANGAASVTAPRLFEALGAQADFIANTPNGTNINDCCGSTHMELLHQKTVAGGYDIGIAFDGDADRCLMVDEKGQVIDGDRIIGVLAAHMQQNNTLRGGAVGTIMSNLGLHEFLGSKGIELQCTKVGDRHVLEEMRRGGHNVGGEQSGHVILSDYATTGDGQLTAIHFLAVLKQSGLKASELTQAIPKYPQVTINVDVPNKIKAKVAEMKSVQEVSRKIAETFGSSGRIIIRPSGTEAKVRVMVEGKDEAAVREMARMAAAAIEAETAKGGKVKK